MKRKLLLIGILVWGFNSVFGQILYDNGPIVLNSARTTYSIQGNKWNTNHLKYYFQNGTNDIASNNEFNAVREAFDIWSCNTLLTFTEVNSASNADIVILWGNENHGDGYPFDAQNGVLAHAFFPPPNGGSLAGDVHFDDSENWTLNIRANYLQPIDLVTVAAHEIGHSLGLNHSSDSNALMYAYYLGSHRSLDIDDINGIQTIYGIKNTNTGLSNISNVCYSSNKTIQYTNPCGSNLIVNSWQASPNVRIVSSNNSSVTIRATYSNSYGSGWVKATLSNGVVLKESFEVGIPRSTDFYLTQRNAIHGTIQLINNWNIFRIKGGDSDLSWEVSATNSMVVHRESGRNFSVFPTISSGRVNISIRTRNSCGRSPWLVYSFHIGRRAHTTPNNREGPVQAPITVHN